MHTCARSQDSVLNEFHVSFQTRARARSQYMVLNNLGARTLYHRHLITGHLIMDTSPLGCFITQSLNHTDTISRGYFGKRPLDNKDIFSLGHLNIRNKHLNNDMFSHCSFILCNCAAKIVEKNGSLAFCSCSRCPRLLCLWNTYDTRIQMSSDRMYLIAWCPHVGKRNNLHYHLSFLPLQNPLSFPSIPNDITKKY